VVGSPGPNGRGGGDEGTYTVVLCIYMYFVGKRMVAYNDL
jgi:hypothetical protein